jgi:hypothetical protein
VAKRKCTRHRWAWVGGCDSNPGVVDIGGGWDEYTMQCERCGLMAQWKSCYRGVGSAASAERSPTRYFMPTASADA